MASGVYANAKYLIALGQFGWTTGSTFRALLVGASYVFNHAHTTVADIVAFEVAGGTYARQPVEGRAVYLDLAGNRARIDASDVLFPLLGGVTPSGLIIYKQVGGDDSTPGNDPLICFVDTPTVPATGLNYMVEFDPSGVFTLTEC